MDSSREADVRLSPEKPEADAKLSFEKQVVPERQSSLDVHVCNEDAPSEQDSVESETHPHSKKQERRRKRGHQVWLHVYDLDSYTGKLNDYVLRPLSAGAFHCGVEVLLDEWFFACGDSDCSGVLCNEPKGHQVHVYKESICMGDSPLTEDGVKSALCSAMDDWSANSYHPIHRNCLNFAEDLCKRLQVPEAFPTWVRGAPDVGKNPLLLPIADWGWRWIQWYNTEPEPPPQQESAGVQALTNAGSSSSGYEGRATDKNGSPQLLQS
jgi:hypothetical protein